MTAVETVNQAGRDPATSSTPTPPKSDSEVDHEAALKWAKKIIKYQDVDWGRVSQAAINRAYALIDQAKELAAFKEKVGKVSHLQYKAGNWFVTNCNYHNTEDQKIVCHDSGGACLFVESPDA